MWLSLSLKTDASYFYLKKTTIQNQTKYHSCIKAIYHLVFTSSHMPLNFASNLNSKTFSKECLCCRLAYFYKDIK